MKRRTSMALLTALLASATAGADDMSGMKDHGNDMKGMNMGDHSAMGQSSPTHKATGTVKAIDPAKGTITIAHGPVASAKWPGMQMAFNITPELGSNVQVGQQVEFEFVIQGKGATVTRVTAMK